MASDATTNDAQFKRFESCARHDATQRLLLATYYCNAREFYLEFERVVEAGKCDDNFESYFAAYKTRYNNTHNLQLKMSRQEFCKAGRSHYTHFMKDMRKEHVTSSLSGAPRPSADVIDPARDGYEPATARSTLAEYFGIKGYSNKAQIQTLFKTYVRPPAARSPPLHTATHRPRTSAARVFAHHPYHPLVSCRRSPDATPRPPPCPLGCHTASETTWGKYGQRVSAGLRETASWPTRGRSRISSSVS